MPKLLFVGIVERTCRATVIREIPGITDCFQIKDDSKKGEEPEIKVCCLAIWSLSGLTFGAAYHKRVQFPRIVAIRCRRG